MLFECKFSQSPAQALSSIEKETMKSVLKGCLVSYSPKSRLQCHIIQENHDIQIIIFQYFIQADNGTNGE